MPLIRQRERALMDLLPWDSFVAPGVLRNVDGGLVSTLRYRGPDLASATPEELDGLTRTVTEAFSGLGDGWLIQFDSHRTPAPGYPPPGAFPDPFTAAIDEERRRAYEGRGVHYQTEHHLTLSHLPPAAERPSLMAVRSADRELSAEGQHVDSFLDRVEEVRSLLSTVLRPRRLNTAEMVRYLYRCLTCRDHPLAVPEDLPLSIEALFGVGDLWAGTRLRLGETHLVPLAVAAYPEEVEPAALDALDELPVPHRVSLRYVPFDVYTAQSKIKRTRSRWSTAGIGIRDLLAGLIGGVRAKPRFGDRYAPRMAEDADNALAALTEEQTTAGYLTTVVLLWGPDHQTAIERARRVSKELRHRGYPTWTEELNALSAFLSTLPGHGRVNVRRPLVPLRAMVHLAPLTSVWAGERTHPLPRLRGEPPHVIASSSGSTPFALNLAVGDVQHTAIIGPTGSGKSVLLNLLLAQWLRYPDAQIYSLDKGLSQLALVDAAGGDHYGLSTDPELGVHRFAPLAHLEDGGDRQRATDWVLGLFELSGIDATAAVRAAVGKGLRALGEGRRRSLSTFALKLQDRALRQALEPYVLDGPYAHLLDGPASPLRSGRFSVFEMEALLPLRREVLVPLALHLFSEVERRLDGRPTLFAVEEFPAYLADPLFADRFSQYLLEFRKQNAGFVFVSQSVSSLLDSSLRSVVLESVPTKIYLPNPAATEGSTRDGYRALGLSDRQIAMVAEAVPKRDYYVVSPLGARLFRLDLSPAALTILGLAGPAARETLAYARRTWGSDWLTGLLEDEGHGDFADLYRSLAAPRSRSEEAS